MSLMLLRYPSCWACCGNRAACRTPAAARRSRTPAAALLLLEGRLDATVQGIDSDYEEAFSAAAGTAAAPVSPAPLLRGRTDPLPRRPAAASAPATDGEVAALERQRVAAVDALARAWTAAQDDLQRLLALRKPKPLRPHVDAPGHRRVAAGGDPERWSSSSPDRSRSRLRRLSRVADRVSDSGDYSLRAEWNSARRDRPPGARLQRDARTARPAARQPAGTGGPPARPPMRSANWSKRCRSR